MLAPQRQDLSVLTPPLAPHSPAAKEHLGRGSWKWQSPVFVAVEWFVLEVLLVWARSRKASKLKLPFPFLGLEVLPKNEMGDFQVFQRRREIFVLLWKVRGLVLLVLLVLPHKGAVGTEGSNVHKMLEERWS